MKNFKLFNYKKIFYNSNLYKIKNNLMEQEIQKKYLNFDKLTIKKSETVD